MAPSPAGALNADALLDYMVKSIPSQETQDSPLRNAYAAIGLFSHACMLAVGFKLIGLGEDHRIDAQSEPTAVQKLPQEWNASPTYAFRYTHPQSSMEYLVKVNRLGGKAIILAVGLGDDRTAQFEIKVQDYVSEGSLKDLKSDNITAQSLKDVFISTGRIADLSSLYKLNIIQKVAPGLRKEGYEESTTQERHEQPRRNEETRLPERDPLRDDQPQPARPYPFNDPLAAAPRRPGPVPDFAPPGFEDEYEMGRRPGVFPDGRPGRPFGNIGEQDLYPPGLGPHDPLRIGPGGGYRGGGGMHPTFDDPIFGGQGGHGGYDPQAPPGARYDPVGPGDGPPNLRPGSRFSGGRGGGGFGGPPNPFGGFGSGDFI